MVGKDHLLEKADREEVESDGKVPIAYRPRTTSQLRCHLSVPDDRPREDVGEKSAEKTEVEKIPSLLGVSRAIDDIGYLNEGDEADP